MKGNVYKAVGRPAIVVLLGDSATKGMTGDRTGSGRDEGIVVLFRSDQVENQMTFLQFAAVT